MGVIACSVLHVHQRLVVQSSAAFSAAVIVAAKSESAGVIMVRGTVLAHPTPSN